MLDRGPPTASLSLSTQKRRGEMGPPTTLVPVRQFFSRGRGEVGKKRSGSRKSFPSQTWNISAGLSAVKIGQKGFWTWRQFSFFAFSGLVNSQFRRPPHLLLRLKGSANFTLAAP